MAMLFDFIGKEAFYELSEREYRLVKKKLGGVMAREKRPVSVADLIAAGLDPDDIMEMVLNYCETRAYRKPLKLWIADCAAHAHHIYAARNPGDNRLTDAITEFRALTHASQTIPAEILHFLTDIAIEEPRNAKRADVIDSQMNRLALRMSDVELEDWPIS